MKTLLKIFCLLAFLGFSMETKAQTKEETIAWLKEKLNKYMEDGYLGLTSNIVLKRVDDCEIVFNYTMNWSNGSRQYQQILPTAVFTIDDSGRFNYSVNVVSVQELGKEAKFYKESTDIKLGNREENIRARVEKALKHLASFCPKKKETF